MSDRIFFFLPERGRRWEERFVKGGGCNRGNHVKPHCYYSSKDFHKGKILSFLWQNNIFDIVCVASAWASSPWYVLDVKGGGCWLRLTLRFWCPPFLETGGWGHRGKKIRWGTRGFISGKMLLLLSGPAVLFPRRALKLLKLTYYLLDWANTFVFFFCACVCSWLQLFHFPLHFNQIECSGVTIEDSTGGFPFCKVNTVSCVQQSFFPLRFISYITRITSLKDMIVFACLMASVCFSCVQGSRRSARRQLEL